MRCIYHFSFGTLVLRDKYPRENVLRFNVIVEESNSFVLGTYYWGIRTKSPGQTPLGKPPTQGQNTPGQTPQGQNTPSIFYISLTVIHFINRSK